MDLLYVRHPNDEVHQKQVELLNSLPVAVRSQHAQVLRFGNATMHYYNDVEPTEDDYKDWLHGLPENIRKDIIAGGYEKHKTSLPLMRHAQERRDIGLTEFVRTLLNDDDFSDWVRLGK